MKHKKSFILILVLLLIATTIWFIFKDQNSVKENHDPELKSSTQKISKYVCPMHPQIVSEKPGRCPICGMDLVMVEDNEEHKSHDVTHEGEDHNEEIKDHHSEHKENLKEQVSKEPRGLSKIKLTLDKQQMIGVKLGRVEKKSLFKSIRAPGRIAFDPELYTAQSEFLEAIKQWNQIKNSPLIDVRENTRQMIQSSKIRLKVLGLSDDQISKLGQKGSQSEGLLVGGKGQENWIYADVFEVDLPYIKKGLSAQINANFLQGKTLAGKVISVDQVIDPNTKTAKVRIQLLENHPSIRPESYVNITIFAPQGEHLSVPLEAIMDTGRDIYLFVKKENNIFEPRKITVILETDDDAAISKGAIEGEEIVIGANFMIDSESRLKSVIRENLNKENTHNH